MLIILKKKQNMSNYVMTGPGGSIPTVKYLEDLIDAGILSQQVGLMQIQKIKEYNQNKLKQFEARKLILQNMIKENQLKQNQSKTQNLQK